jgi:hypothetical protein
LLLLLLLLLLLPSITITTTTACIHCTSISTWFLSAFGRMSAILPHPIPFFVVVPTIPISIVGIALSRLTRYHTTATATTATCQR